MKNLLFIYGTLITGVADKRLNYLIQRYSQDLGKATMRGRLYDLGDYPAAILDPAAGKIQGLVLRISHPERLFPYLDQYEGHEYQRRKVIIANYHRTLTAWCYLHVKPLKYYRRIKPGRYKTNKMKKKS